MAKKSTRPARTPPRRPRRDEADGVPRSEPPPEGGFFSFDRVDGVRRKIVKKKDRFGRKTVRPGELPESSAKKKRPPVVKYDRTAMMQTLTVMNHKEFGLGTVLVGTDLDNVLVGLPLPSLALEWLFGLSVWPLSMLHTFVGKPGVGKTSLALDVARWFVQCGGICQFQHTEFKIPPALVKGILGCTRTDDPKLAVHFHNCTNIEDWQERITRTTQWVKNRMLGTAEAPGTGKVWPFLQILDSLDGRLAEEAQSKVLEDGYGGRGHPVGALIGKNWLGGWLPELFGWPFSLLIVNHLREQLDDRGNTERRVPGGASWQFAMAAEVEVRHVEKRTEYANFASRRISLLTTKNSLGPTGRKVTVRIRDWLEDDEHGRAVHRIVFDWEWASIYALSGISGQYLKRLKDRDVVLETKSPNSDTGCMAKIAALGMREFLPFPEVGVLLHQNADVMERVRQALGILPGRLMHGNFSQQLLDALKEMP